MVIAWFYQVKSTNKVEDELRCMGFIGVVCVGKFFLIFGNFILIQSMHSGLKFEQKVQFREGPKFCFNMIVFKKRHIC